MRRKLAMAGLLPAAILPAQAAAKTEVRFAHAVPGAGQGELDVVRATRHRAIERALFGHVTSYQAVRSGMTELALRAGGKTVATAQARLAKNARYTVVALAPASGLELKVYRDGAAKASVARVRVIHAAPELGAPNLVFDGKQVVHAFAFGAATPYLSVKPGKHSASAMRGKSGAALVSVHGVVLPAGTASTAFVMGSRGEPVRIVLARDATAKASHPKKSSPAPARGSAVHVVRHGESLWEIAARRLGRHASDAQVKREVRRLWRLNSRHVASGDPDVIVPGLRLKLA